MASRGDQWLLEGVGQGGAPALWPLDQAMEYLRENFVAVMLRYTLAMLPYSIVIIALTQAVATGHRGDVRALCVALTVATIWRWIGLAWMQRQIQIDVAGPRAVPFWRTIWSIVRARSVCNLALTGGALIVIASLLGWFAALVFSPLMILPAAIGMFMSVVCTPVLFSGEYAAPVPPATGPALRTGPTLANAMGWMWRARGRLWRISWTLTIGTTLASIVVTAFAHALTSSTFPDWLGFNAASIRVITNSSVGWNILLYYVAFVLFDVYFHVVGVFMFYDLQARRLGSDLFARLDALNSQKRASP